MNINKMFKGHLEYGKKLNPSKVSVRNKQLEYTNKINQIVQKSSSVPPLLDMTKQMQKVRENKTTIPLSVYNGTTSRVK